MRRRSCKCCLLDSYPYQGTQIKVQVAAFTHSGKHSIRYINSNPCLASFQDNFYKQALHINLSTSYVPNRRFDTESVVRKQIFLTTGHIPSYGFAYSEHILYSNLAAELVYKSFNDSRKLVRNLC